VVGDWHEIADRLGLQLAEIVAGILTPTTTSELPPAWQGNYDDQRAAAWIEDRDDESPTLLVVDHRTVEPIGLLILFESDSEVDAGTTDVRVGYVIAEPAWGQGLASELVGALVAWGRERPSIGSMSAGVNASNHASVRVLHKTGFRQVGSEDGERLYGIATDA
jgi:RimJ/RimL family protein N-acetyltransferase